MSGNKKPILVGNSRTAPICSFYLLPYSLTARKPLHTVLPQEWAD